MSPRVRATLAIAGAGALLVGAVLLAVGLGSLSVPPKITLAAIGKGILGRAAQLGSLERIVWEVRLPRVVVGALVGASLGASGAATQGLFRNPLADPYLLGVASGAALGATLSGLLLGHGASPEMGGLGAGVLGPAFAFGGGLGAVFLTLAVARAGPRATNDSLVLAGVVVSGILTAMTTYLVLRDGDRLRAVVSWTLGNLSLAGWPQARGLLPYALLGGAWLFAQGRALDALQLGDDTAHTLGVRVGRTRLAVIAGASLATGAAIAHVGSVGFVGLIAPHVMRRLGAASHRPLIAASALGGAALLVLADLGARTLARPAELPVGVIMTLTGGPFFLWLLRRGHG
ncbi:MAG: iron ABC transporter permease [Polyangiaceae bacterium]|nr:iron ABC transporter permease [Polyangiaceae bacterium]